MGAAALLAVGVAVPAWGQTGAGDGYLFGQPTMQFTLRGGFSRPGASSDLFTESFDMFTLKKSSFMAPDVGAEIGIRLAPRLDLTLGAEYAGRSTKSEYRSFYDNNRQPIEQTTTFQRIPLTAGLKAYLAPRGRSIGTLAWIPSAVVPWVGAAAGATKYHFVQEGDFIGSAPAGAPLPIHSDRLESHGWGFAWQGMGGVDLNMSTRTALTIDARYTRSQASLDGRYFQGYQDLDLSGVSLGFGLTFRL
jgi:hypothetical protein